MAYFEMFAEKHPTAAGIIAAVFMLAAFGIAGSIERGTIQLPF